jgi:hypothetical protein
MTIVQTISERFKSDPFCSNTGLFRLAELQQPDSDWSGNAAEEIDSVLVQAGMQEHAKQWVIDCRSTICTVTFDSAIADFDEDEASSLLTETMFQQVTWSKDYRSHRAYLILVRSGYFEV